jgi:hypothetical protein
MEVVLSTVTSVIIKKKCNKMGMYDVEVDCRAGAQLPKEKHYRELMSTVVGLEGKQLNAWFSSCAR